MIHKRGHRRVVIRQGIGHGRPVVIGMGKICRLLTVSAMYIRMFPGTVIGIVPVFHYLGHGYGHTTYPHMTVLAVLVGRTEGIVIFTLIPCGRQQRAHILNIFRSFCLRIQIPLPQLFHLCVRTMRELQNDFDLALRHLQPFGQGIRQRNMGVKRGLWGVCQHRPETVIAGNKDKTLTAGGIVYIIQQSIPRLLLPEKLQPDLSRSCPFPQGNPLLQEIFCNGGGCQRIHLFGISQESQ